MTDHENGDRPLTATEWWRVLTTMCAMALIIIMPVMISAPGGWDLRWLVASVAMLGVEAHVRGRQA